MCLHTSYSTPVLSTLLASHGSSSSITFHGAGHGGGGGHGREGSLESQTVNLPGVSKVQVVSLELPCYDLTNQPTRELNHKVFPLRFALTKRWVSIFLSFYENLAQK